MPRATILVQPGKTYAFRVRGMNGAVKGPWSEVLYTEIGSDATAPAAPTGLTATPAPGGLYLRWTNPAVGDLAYCRIYVSTSSIPVDSQGRVTGVTPIANVDTDAVAVLGLNPGTYYCRVEAVDRAGNRSSASGQVSATVGLEAVPDARANYTASDVDTPEEVAAALNALGGTVNAILARLRSHRLIAT